METTINGLNFSSASTITNNNTSYTIFNQYYPKELKDVLVTPEKIEITYVQRAKFSYTTTNFTINPPYTVYNPDIAIKEIYGTRNGILCLLKTVHGRVIPPQEIPETYEFDE